MTVTSREWVLDQVVMLEDNSEVFQDQALKHEDSRELIYQSDVLVKNMDTLSLEWTTIFTVKKGLCFNINNLKY